MNELASTAPCLATIIVVAVIAIGFLARMFAHSEPWCANPACVTGACTNCEAMEDA